MLKKRNNNARLLSGVTTATRDPRQGTSPRRLVHDFIGFNHEHRLDIGGYYCELLCSRNHALKKPVVDSRQKTHYYAVEKSPFFQDFSIIMASNWIRQSRKLVSLIAFSSGIHASEKLESPAAYSYEYHIPTCLDIKKKI